MSLGRAPQRASVTVSPPDSVDEPASTPPESSGLWKRRDLVKAPSEPWTGEQLLHATVNILLVLGPYCAVLLLCVVYAAWNHVAQLLALSNSPLKFALIAIATAGAAVGFATTLKRDFRWCLAGWAVWGSSQFVLPIAGLATGTAAWAEFAVPVAGSLALCLGVLPIRSVYFEWSASRTP